VRNVEQELTCSANGKMDDELVVFEVSEIKAQIEVSKISKETSWMTFVNVASNRRRIGVILLIGLCTQLSGNGVVQVSWLSFKVPISDVRLKCSTILSPSLRQ
jgi:hypothetical protein